VSRTALPYRRHRLQVGGLTVTLTRHAYLRYLTRVKGVVDADEANVADRELERLLKFAELVGPDQAPRWLAGADTHQRTGTQPLVGYLVLMDVVFVLVADGPGSANATTCLARGHLGEHARSARTARARRDRDQFSVDNRRRAGAYKRDRQLDWAQAQA
jgi:hypothetical protein